MMRTTVKRMAWFFFAVSFAFGAYAADPTISDVVVRQRWPWSRLVDISYVLSCDATQSVDVALSAWDGSTSLTLPIDSLSGDLYSVAPGAGRIVWNPTKSAYTNSILTRFRVTLTPTVSPVYMILDLTKAAGSSDQVEYIFPGDARLETYGRFTNVWFGVTNDSVYATTKLVMRRIRAGNFNMGASANIATTLTKEFYAGVFQVTQRQWELIYGNKPSFFNNATYYATRPVEQVSYDSIRGPTNGTPHINWPLTGSAVSSTSFIGRFRTKTGFDSFDLPTEAKWEYLCRAGTTTYYNDGLGTPANTASNTQMAALGRYKYNGGLINGVSYPAQNCGLTNGTMSAGTYLPNAWGLYDTHGNIWEVCLDWSTGSLPGGTDLIGPTSGSSRVCRGGGFDSAGDRCCSAARGTSSSSEQSMGKGLRLIRNLP